MEDIGRIRLERLMNADSETPTCQDLLSTVLEVQRELVVSEDAATAMEMLTRSIVEFTGSSLGYISSSSGEAIGKTQLHTYRVVGNSKFQLDVDQLQDALQENADHFGPLAPLEKVINEAGPVLLGKAELGQWPELLPGVTGVESWAGIPLAPGGRLLGVLVIAGRSGGYESSLIADLSPLVRVAGHLLLADQEKQARVQIEKSHAIYRRLYDSLLEHSLDCIVSMDSSGQIVEWNPAAEATFGWKRAEVVGRSLSEVIVPKGMRDAHTKGLTHYNETGQGPVIDQRIEVPALRKDGAEIPVELAIMASELDDGVLFTAHLRDVTAARAFKDAIQEARDAAEASNKAKTNFVATISHEIRTPINAIMGAMGLLESAGMDSNSRAILNTAKHSADALLSLVNDVLDFARIESGKLDLELAPVRLSELCDSVLQLLANRANQGGTKLASVIYEGLYGDIMLDSGKVRQVLLNLVGNAVKFSEKASVRLDVRREQDMLKFEVTDTGIGISEEEQKELFKEFVQLGTRRLSGGTGLGLNISRRLVEFMGGSVGVTSAPGQGSTFWFTIPLVANGDQSPDIAAEGRTILLVNEGNFYIRAMKDQLQALGVKTRIVRDLSRAAEMLYPGSQVSLVVLPLEEHSVEYSASSVQMITRLCADAQIPVLAISDSAHSADEMLDYRLGVSAMMQPPLLHEDIKATISSAESGPGDVERTWSMRMDLSSPGKKFTRLLLAEDSQANRLVMSEVLRRAGYEVDVVGDGVEAVAAVKSLPYDVVLMDVDMPVMNGLKATQAIRELDGDMAKVPVIALTAHVVTGFREKVLASGMDDYLSKPVDKQLMCQKIDLWAARKKARAPAEQSELIDDSVLQQLAADTSDELVPQMLKVFMRELHMRAEQIADGVKHRDLSSLGKEAHALKSSAATFGAVAIAEQARKMDDACREAKEELALQSAKKILSLIEPTADCLGLRIKG